MEEHLLFIWYQAKREANQQCSQPVREIRLYLDLLVKMHDPSINQSTCIISSPDSFLSFNAHMYVCTIRTPSYSIVPRWCIRRYMFFQYISTRSYRYGNKSRRSTCNKLLSSPLLRPRPMVLFSNQADVYFFPYPLPAALTCNVVCLRRQWTK